MPTQDLVRSGTLASRLIDARGKLLFPQTVVQSSISLGPINGLIFPANATAGSDIRIIFDGSILLPRTLQTVLWKKYNNGQTNYVADTWSSHNTGAFASDNYEFGCHPYPSSTGTVDAAGQNTGVIGSGVVHYHEIAGLGGHDYLASPGGSSVLVVDGRWYSQARSAGPVTLTTRHRYYFDQGLNSSQVIEQSITTALIPAAGATPAFYFGCSDWRAGLGGGGAGTNDETPAGIHRGYQLFNAELTAAQILALSAFNYDSEVLSYCSANGLTLWYLNMNPTPSDITDKSGNGRNPTWANANRPTLYTG